MFLKLLGASALLISGVGFSYSLGQSASAMLSQCDAWCSMLRYIKLQVDCFAIPISQILSRCDRALLDGCGYRGEREPKDLRELIDGALWHDGETLVIVEGFASEFGKGYREEQLRSCEYYCAQLENRRARLASEIPSKKRLYTTLCLSSAAALVILFI